MGCQRVPYKHAGGAYYADASDCNGCDLNGTEHCDGWRKNPKGANRRTVMESVLREIERDGRLSMDGYHEHPVNLTKYRKERGLL